MSSKLLLRPLLAPLLLAAVATFASVPATARAAFPGKNGRIAFEPTDDKGDSLGRILSVLATGADRRPVGPGVTVAYSADGRLIAFADEPDNSLYVARADGSQRRLVTTDGYRPAWSPDGRFLAFEREVRGTEVGESDVLVVRSDGGKPRLVASQGGLPAWSPDGKLIAFLGGDAAETVRPDGSGRRTLLRFPDSPPPFQGNPLEFSSLDWAPDGRSLAIARDLGDPDADAKRTDVLRVTSHGRRLGRIVAAKRIRAALFSPDGRRLLLERVKGDGRDPSILSVVSLRGGRARVLAEGTSASWQPLPSSR